MEKSPNFQNFQKAYHLLISNEEPNYREQFIQGHLKTHFANLMLACQGEFEKVGLFLIGQRKKQYKDYQKALHLTKYEIVSKPSQEKSLNADFQKIVDLASDVQMTKAKSYDTSSLKAKLDKTDKLLEIFGKVFKNLNIDSKHQNEFAILLPSAKQVVIVKIERGKNKDENLANIVTLKTLLLVKQDLKKDLILK